MIFISHKVAASLSSPAHVEPLTRMFWRRIYEFHKVARPSPEEGGKQTT
jgi:hypothetical protein